MDTHEIAVMATLRARSGAIRLRALFELTMMEGALLSDVAEINMSLGAHATSLIDLSNSREFAGDGRWQVCEISV